MEWESISTVHAFRPRLSSVWANSSLRQRVYLAGPLEAFPPNCGTYGWTRRLLPYSSASGRGTRIHPSSPQHYFVCPPLSFLPSFLASFTLTRRPAQPAKCQVPTKQSTQNLNWIIFHRFTAPNSLIVPSEIAAGRPSASPILYETSTEKKYEEKDGDILRPKNSEVGSI